MNTPASRHCATIVVVLTAVAACSGEPAVEVVDKAGGETLVLRLATIDDVNNNGQSFGPEAFVNGLQAVSGGRLKVEVTKPYGEGAADAESKLVSAIASGALDGGWPSTRAFANAGIQGLEAVEAPMLLTSYAAQKALVSGPVGEKALRHLDGSGIVALGLAVGPLRRPFAADAPLVGPDDWQGVRFRAYNSPVQEQTIRALGATPVDLSFAWIDHVKAGTLRGAEFDIAQYAAAGFTTEAPYVVANVVLWPKVFVLSLSQKRFESMTEQQREWVRQAARQATQASVEAAYDESSIARQLCSDGVRFVTASDEQVTALRGAVAPVTDLLAADPKAAVLLSDIQSLAREHKATDVPDVPASCMLAAGQDPDDPRVPDETSALPDGLYRVEITPADVAAFGASNGPGWSGTWTLKVEDGIYVITCRPLEAPGKDCGNVVYDGPLEAGHLRGEGDTVYFDDSTELLSELTGCKLPPSSAPGHCVELDTYWMTWTLDGDTLHFSEPGGMDAVTLVIEPWKKIG